MGIRGIVRRIHTPSINVESSHQRRVTFDDVVVIHVAKLVGASSRRVVIAMHTTVFFEGVTLLDITVINNVAATIELVNDALEDGTTCEFITHVRITVLHLRSINSAQQSSRLNTLVSLVDVERRIDKGVLDRTIVSGVTYQTTHGTSGRSSNAYFRHRHRRVNHA